LQNYIFMDNEPIAIEIALTAAGGWVLNADRDVLWIHRLGQWDLPKGKLESGESLESCAVREVEEECGIQGVRLVAPLCQTVHRYPLNGQIAVKTTHWYAMEVDGVPVLTPQKEERISRAEWVPQEDCWFLAEASYATLKEVEEAAFATGLSRR
jgi:8-oxo-dGTP pyrophosphatase MutT (NUDIX family)